MKSKFLFLAVFFLICNNSHAYCTQGGQVHPPGTIIGGLICQPDGSWQ